MKKLAHHVNTKKNKFKTNQNAYLKIMDLLLFPAIKKLLIYLFQSILNVFPQRFLLCWVSSVNTFNVCHMKLPSLTLKALSTFRTIA